jgi:putative GTP pyrophosphokinase
MFEEAGSLSTAAVDQLGERLRKGMTVDDLRALDQYRRAFRTDYDAVISAIVDKLRRGSMRLSQMQDIAGCRLVVADTLVQNEAVNRLVGMFPVSLVDRREKPSHGYRAVHVVVRLARRPIEIQVRTVLQHLWAEFSEKAADAFGIELKYGGGHKTVRCALDQASEWVARFERLEPNKDQIGDQLVELRSVIETPLLEFLAIVRKQGDDLSS